MNVLLNSVLLETVQLVFFIIPRNEISPVLLPFFTIEIEFCPIVEIAEITQFYTTQYSFDTILIIVFV